MDLLNGYARYLSPRLVRVRIVVQNYTRLAYALKGTNGEYPYIYCLTSMQRSEA